jgi:IS5 family transposase
MIVDRYDPVNLFKLVPQLQLELDPVLAALDKLLDDDVLFQHVKADLLRRYPRSACKGRRSTPVEVILRMLVLKHLYHWSHEEVEHFVNDSLVLRQFCRLYLAKAPDDTTLIRWSNHIQPETLHALLDRVVALAQTAKVTRGRKLRIDGTVVETNVQYPTDSSLLGDGVRVLSRIVRKASQVLGEAAQGSRHLFRERIRSAKKQVKRILDATRRRGQQADETMRDAYEHLVETTHAMVEQARQVKTVLQEQATQAVHSVLESLDTVIPRVEQVLEQTRRRVFQGEAVPAGEKIVSLFEPHTAIIRKGKIANATEFGRVVWLDEVEGGIISRYDVLEGNPAEEQQVKPSLAHHVKVFKHPPTLLTGDRGTYSAENERYAHKLKVKQVVLPKPGAKSAARAAHEKQEWFQRGRRWRAGIEGRISGLKRGQGLERCRYHGDEGMERWVGWGVIAYDLRVIARKTAA